MENTEISLQELFDGFLELTPSEACLVVEIQDMMRKKFDTLFNEGYSEDVMQGFDHIAEKYELNKSHRTRGEGTRMHIVGGGEATIH